MELDALSTRAVSVAKGIKGKQGEENASLGKRLELIEGMEESVVSEEGGSDWLVVGGVILGEGETS